MSFPIELESGRVVGRELDAAELAAIEEPFAAAGFQLRWEYSRLTPDGRLRLQAKALEQGERVAWFERMVGAKDAWHRSSLTYEGHRQRGVGRRLLAAAVAFYDSLGIERIHLLASGDGRYAWARCGFDFVDDKVAELAAERGVDLGEARHAWEVAELPQGRALLFEPALDAWEGVLDLRQGSPGRARFEAYCLTAG